MELDIRLDVGTTGIGDYPVRLISSIHIVAVVRFVRVPSVPPPESGAMDRYLNRHRQGHLQTIL